MIGALRLDEGIIASMTLRGGVKGKTFLDFLARLAPRLHRGDIVCLDHLNLHKSTAARALVEAAGATLLFLPKYSPDLNPIEAAWSKVKGLLRKAAPGTVSKLRTAMRAALRTITRQDTAGWFQYCGYPLPGL